MSESDGMVEELIVEMVEEEFPMKCVFDDAKELLLSKMVNFKANNINHVIDSPPDSVKTVFDTPPVQ